MCPQSAKAIRGGYKRKKENSINIYIYIYIYYTKNPRSNRVCRVVYSQSQTGRQTALHTEVHHVTILRIAL